jgi:hypothetical protein
MPAPIELPMALNGCGLDEHQLAEQLERYRRLGAGAQVTRPSALALAAEFAANPDPELLRTTVEIERECCSFFTLEFSEAQRRLTISVPDAAHVRALDEIEAALTSTPTAGRLRQSSSRNGCSSRSLIAARKRAASAP